MAKKVYPHLTSSENRQGKTYFKRPQDADVRVGVDIHCVYEGPGRGAFYDIKDANTGEIVLRVHDSHLIENKRIPRRTV